MGLLRVVPRPRRTRRDRSTVLRSSSTIRYREGVRRKCMRTLSIFGYRKKDGRFVVRANDSYATGAFLSPVSRANVARGRSRGGVVVRMRPARVPLLRHPVAHPRSRHRRSGVARFPGGGGSGKERGRQRRPGQEAAAAAAGRATNVRAGAHGGSSGDGGGGRRHTWAPSGQYPPGRATLGQPSCRVTLVCRNSAPPPLYARTHARTGERTNDRPQLSTHRRRRTCSPPSVSPPFGRPVTTHSYTFAPPAPPFGVRSIDPLCRTTSRPSYNPFNPRATRERPCRRRPAHGPTATVRPRHRHPHRRRRCCCRW